MSDTRHTLRPLSDSPRKQLVPTLLIFVIESIFHTVTATHSIQGNGSVVRPTHRPPANRPTGQLAGRPDHDQQLCYCHAPTVNPEAVTAVVELLMMGMRMSDTCWAVHRSKRQPARPRPTALLPPHSNSKTRGFYYGYWPPDDGR
jgi:hypothetical protein